MTLSRSQWLLLLLLSILWGAAFFFVGVAVRELPPLTIVLARVAIASAALAPVVLLSGNVLPRGLAGWWPFIVMSLLNNVVPFTAIVTAQGRIGSGLAAVLNATTPIFTVVLMHVLTSDKATLRAVFGTIVGLAGVAVIAGPAAFAGDSASVSGIALVLLATFSYGLSGVWARRLRTTPPIVSAFCQLAVSSCVIGTAAAVIDRPWLLDVPSGTALAALAGLAIPSTALAYIIFFRIVAVSGPSNVMLVTLLIPISAIALGVLVLGEHLPAHQIIGALVVVLALVLIDGRVAAWLAVRLRGRASEPLRKTPD